MRYCFSSGRFALAKILRPYTINKIAIAINNMSTPALNKPSVDIIKIMPKMIKKTPLNFIFAPSRPIVADASFNCVQDDRDNSIFRNKITLFIRASQDYFIFSDFFC